MEGAIPWTTVQQITQADCTYTLTTVASDPTWIGATAIAVVAILAGAYILGKLCDVWIVKCGEW